MGVVINNPLPDKIQDFINKAELKNIKNKKAYEHCIKADALRIRNLFWESISEYLEAIKHDDSNVEAFKGLALSYKHVGYLKSAIESLEKAKRITPFDKTIYFELGSCYSEDANFSCALKEIRRAIKLDPDYLEAKFSLALVHELCNELDLALQIYNKIIEDRPSYIAAYNNLGSLYMRLGMYNYSIQTFKKLLEINPDFVRAYLGIAITFDKMGRGNDAIRYYKKYKELKPNSANTPYIMDRINELRAERKARKTSHLKLVTD